MFFILTLLFFYSQKFTYAYEQTSSTCYSQCLAYKFVWQGTYCYDVFADNCTEENGNTIIKTIKFLKSVYDVVKSGDNIDVPFKAMFVCKPLIESCIVPSQQSCEQTCQIDKNTYAPDLSVGHPESSFHGVYYDEKTKQLYFKLVNNGLAYAWDIDVEATYKHTPSRDGVMSNEQQLFKEKVEHLIYFGARNGPPKSFSDTVGDFLIKESLNGQYLHNFKSWLVDSFNLHSDSKNYNIPNYWIKAVPFTPKPGELNQITFKVDPNNIIPEVWEQNNTFTLNIDLRPTPARYTIENLTRHLVENTLNSFLVNFQIKNTGEENGLSRIKIYDGKFEEGKTPVYQTEQNISGKNIKDIETTINLDISSEPNPYCGQLKEYTLVVVDEEGTLTKSNFFLPVYVGSVNGQVDDILKKRVKDATIKSSTGQETQSTDIGYYHLKGITALGKVTLTATHPEYSKRDTKEVEFKFDNEFNACKEGNLIFNSVNFVLQDQNVIYNVTIKDSQGNQITAHVLAVNADFRKEADINGTGPFPDLQPGKYLFTVSAPGYKTIRQDVNAVPEINNLEFVLEKLNGRPNDNGLSLITPRLLWKKTLGTGEKLIGNMTGTKNGKLLVIHTVDNKAKASKLFFLDLLSGNLIKETPVPFSLSEQRFVGLDSSYDGGTVGLFVNPGSSINRQDSVLKLFNAGGNEIGTTTLDRKTSISMEISPDGFYVCPYFLLDKGLHKYTRHEIEGKGDDDFKRNPATCGDYFLRNNNMVSECEDGLCEETIAKQKVRTIGNITEHTTVTKYDSTNNDEIIVVRTYKKLYYFGPSSWNKEIESNNNYKSVSISPGGKYIIVTSGSGNDHLLQLKVFNNNGEDKTPKFPYKNVNFVFANDKGLFFVQTVLNNIEFYQIGEYDNEYNPTEPTPTAIPNWIDGISYLSRGQFYPLRGQNFASLNPGIIYRADRNIQLNIIRPFTSTSLGILSITKDSLFAINYNWDPILIKGQMTANFDSPVTVYAIKFDRYWTALFQEKLDKFIRHQLPADEYFIVKNIHTKFTVTNVPNKFNLAVTNGQVKITADKTEKTVNSGKQIFIDAKNNIKETFYFDFNNILIFAGIFILIAAGVLIYYRKTKVGGKIINILKSIIVLSCKYFKTFFIWFWKIIKILVPILWKGIKSFLKFLGKIIRKIRK